MRGLLASLFSFYEVQLNVTADSIDIDLNDKDDKEREIKVRMNTNYPFIQIFYGIVWNRKTNPLKKSHIIFFFFFYIPIIFLGIFYAIFTYIYLFFMNL